MTTRLSIRSVYTSYGRRPLLRDINLEIGRGEIVGVIGPNGSGKSTMLRAIVGALALDAGTITLDGRDLSGLTPGERRQHGISMKTQMPRFVPSLTVDANLTLASNFDQSVRGWVSSKPRRAPRVDLAGTPLEGRGRIVAAELSHGEQQWLNLLATFARDPSVVLLDEPAAGQSDADRNETERLIGRLHADDRSIVIIDHDLELIQRLCTRIAVLANGQLVAVGTPSEVRADSAVRAAYLGGGRRDRD